MLVGRYSTENQASVDVLHIYNAQHITIEAFLLLPFMYVYVHR